MAEFNYKKTGSANGHLQCVRNLRKVRKEKKRKWKENERKMILCTILEIFIIIFSLLSFQTNNIR